MTCLKTGCHIYLEQYHEYAYGDAFVYGAGVYLFRLVTVDREPVAPTLHFTVYEIADWFDKGRSNSTLIAVNTRNHGYEGIKI